MTAALLTRMQRHSRLALPRAGNPLYADTPKYATSDQAQEQGDGYMDVDAEPAEQF